MKKKIFSTLAVISLIAVLCFPVMRRVNATGENLSAESIIPENYNDDGDTSRFLFDPRFSTMTASTIQYKNHKISILLYNCSYTGIFNFKPENYVIQSFIRKSDGSFVWLNQVDRENMLNDWSNVRRIGPVDVHKTFDYAPVEIEGASPLKPSIAFEKEGEYGERVKLSGSCDWSKTTYSYDYYSINKKTGKQSMIPDEYTILRADDYLTGFYYVVDQNRGDTPYASTWKHLTSNDATGGTRALYDSLPQNVVSSDKDFYIHVVSKSYTGRISPVSTAKIPKRGVHTVKYDVNGGEKEISPQKKCLGQDLRLSEVVPKQKGYTFIEWQGMEQDKYKPFDLYKRDQESGEYVLKASWKKNDYLLSYDKNEREGKNGKITGEMEDDNGFFDRKGVKENKFVNETVDDLGFNKFSFRGWSTESRDFYKTDSKDYFLIKNNEFDSYPWSKIIEERGLCYDDNAKIKLYAVWDEAPKIVNLKDRYITDEEVDKITEERLLEGVTAEDREDGRIESVRIKDFSVEDLKLDGLRKAVELEVRAKDSVGNIGRARFKVWVISSNPIKDDDGATLYTRFVDDKNYNKNDPKKRALKKKLYKKREVSSGGGLIDESIWYWDKDYRESFTRVIDRKVKLVKIFDHKTLCEP